MIMEIEKMFSLNKDLLLFVGLSDAYLQGHLED